MMIKISAMIKDFCSNTDEMGYLIIGYIAGIATCCLIAGLIV